jgi:hypothetical protein
MQALISYILALILNHLFAIVKLFDSKTTKLQATILCFFDFLLGFLLLDPFSALFSYAFLSVAFAIFASVNSICTVGIISDNL